MTNTIQELEQAQLKNDLPEFGREIPCACRSG